MIKKSFKTIFEFPLMLLGFALPIVFVGLAYIPMFTMLYGDMDYAIMVTMMVTWLFMFLFGLFMQFVYMPVLLNYVYEASCGKVDKGWFKRGLKRNWWKVFVGTLIASVPMYVVYFIFFIIMFASMFAAMGQSYIPIIVAGSIFALFMFFWVGFYYTVIVSVTAEEKFDTGFKNIFKVGFKNIPKITLVSLITMVPAWLVSAGIIIYDITDIMNDSVSNQIQQFIQFDNPAFIVVLVLCSIVIAALSVLGMAFVYVYTYKHYIKRRADLMPVDTPEVAANEPAQV